MGRFLAITLGVVTAIGGYLDMGELVSMPALGATYGFALLWALAVGTIGAMVFAEMAGRIELESKRTVQDLVRERPRSPTRTGHAVRERASQSADAGR